MYFDKLIQYFKGSKSAFLAEMSNYRVKQRVITFIVPQGETIVFETPTKCWQWRFFCRVPQDTPIGVTFANGQLNGVLFSFPIVENSTPVFTGFIEFKGVPYLQREDTFSFTNEFREDAILQFDCDLLTATNE